MRGPVKGCFFEKLFFAAVIQLTDSTAEFWVSEFWLDPLGFRVWGIYLCGVLVPFDKLSCFPGMALRSFTRVQFL